MDFLPRLQEEAKKRQGTRTDLATSGPNGPEVTEKRSREEAGALAGVSGRTVERAARVANVPRPENSDKGRATLGMSILAGGQTVSQGPALFIGVGPQGSAPAAGVCTFAVVPQRSHPPK